MSEEGEQNNNPLNLPKDILDKLDQARFDDENYWLMVNPDTPTQTTSGNILPEYLIHKNGEFSMLAFIFHIKKNIQYWPGLNKDYLQGAVDYSTDHIPQDQVPALFKRTVPLSPTPDVFAHLPVDQGTSPSDMMEAKEYRWDLFRCHFDHYITNDKPFWKNDAVWATNGVLLLHASVPRVNNAIAHEFFYKKSRVLKEPRAPINRMEWGVSRPSPLRSEHLNASVLATPIRQQGQDQVDGLALRTETVNSLPMAN